MFIPAFVASLFAEKSDFAQSVNTIFSDPTSWQYNLLYLVLILAFTFSILQFQLILIKLLMT